MFDSDIEDYLNIQLEVPYKLFVSTESTFFNASVLFNGFEDYLEKCSEVTIKMYVKKEVSLEEIEAKLNEKLSFSRGFVNVYTVSEDVFDSINQFLQSFDTINSEYKMDYFRIENR